MYVHWFVIFGLHNFICAHTIKGNGRNVAGSNERDIVMFIDRQEVHNGAIRKYVGVTKLNVTSASAWMDYRWYQWSLTLVKTHRLQPGSDTKNTDRNILHEESFVSWGNFSHVFTLRPSDSGVSISCVLKNNYQWKLITVYLYLHTSSSELPPSNLLAAPATTEKPSLTGVFQPVAFAIGFIAGAMVVASLALLCSLRFLCRRRPRPCLRTPSPEPQHYASVYSWRKPFAISTNREDN